MKPYYQDSHATLYCGDSREVSAALRDAGIVADVIITDPPYGVKWFSGRGQQGFAELQGDDGMTPIVEFLRPVLPVLRRGRHVYCFGADTFDGLAISGVAELVWDKEVISLGNLECPWGKSHQKILFGVYNLSASDRKRGGGNLAARMRKNSILRCQRLHSEEVKMHPTQKPVRLLRELIESSSMIDELVFDPYAGVGSTLLAAKIEVRDFLTYLAAEKHVTFQTQKQALCALVWLFKFVLERDLGWIEGIERARKPEHVPVILSIDDDLHACVEPRAAGGPESARSEGVCGGAFYLGRTAQVLRKFIQ